MYELGVYRRHCFNKFTGQRAVFMQPTYSFAKKSYAFISKLKLFYFLSFNFVKTLTFLLLLLLCKFMLNFINFDTDLLFKILSFINFCTKQYLIFPNSLQKHMNNGLLEMVMQHVENWYFCINESVIHCILDCTDNKIGRQFWLSNICFGFLICFQCSF